MVKKTWRVALALEELLAEIDAAAPKRSRISDGGIGNAAHAARNSDHNPWVKDGAIGVVTARDFTHDPAHGFDAHAFADWLRLRCKAGIEKRVKYVISNERIASAEFSAADRRAGRKDWAWWPYNGTNTHEKHTHVSVSSQKRLYDSRVSWHWKDKKTVADDKPDTGPLTWPHHILTKDDEAAYAHPMRKAGQPIAWSALLRFPPAVAQLRREQTAAAGALTALITATAAQDAAAAASGHQLSAAELEQVARRGATLALDDLDARTGSADLADVLDARTAGAADPGA